jgi:T5SS/PEP-CTERM-associated repeat protein
MRAHLLTTTAVMALLSASTVATRAQTNWTGATSPDWFNALNWTAGVPAGTSATINTTTPNPTVVAAAGATAQSLDVGTPVGLGNLTITNGGTLTTFGGVNVGTGFGRGDVTVTGPGSQLFVINSGVQVGGAGPGIGTLTVTNGGFVNGQVLGPPQLITVGGGGGRLSGALIGDGGVTSTLIRDGGFLVPCQGCVPGQGGSPAAMTVAGNLAFQSGAFYVVQVNPTTASTTNVFGPNVSLAGTVVANFAPGSYVSRSYTILTTASGFTGTFDALVPRLS